MIHRDIANETDKKKTILMTNCKRTLTKCEVWYIILQVNFPRDTSVSKVRNYIKREGAVYSCVVTCEYQYQICLLGTILLAVIVDKCLRKARFCSSAVVVVS